ncbi:MAG: M12 family metallo-peptidase [Acidobacteria bacterium]|nr:M12 family metallo-peptidase [Acidobacteriota bacterium]
MKESPSALVAAALPVLLLAPAASDGQEPRQPVAAQQFEGALSFRSMRCGTTHAAPDGPPRVIDYSVVEAPPGTTTEIGVLFVYTDDLEGSVVRSGVHEWVTTANEFFDNGTSGVRLKVAGVKSAPASVSRASYEDLLTTAIRADPTIERQRDEVGGDVVTVVALRSDSAPWLGTARLWHSGWTVDEMKPQAYSVVLMDPSFDLEFRRAEGLILAHEIGHSLGVAHDRQTLLDAYEADPARNTHPDVLKRWLWDPTGFGYVNPNEQVGQCLTSSCYLGTVMSYADWFLKGFSRPDGELPVYLAEHVSMDAGDHTTNADRALRRTAAAVADFYANPSTADPEPDPEPQPDPEPTTLSACRGGTCLLEDGRFRIRVRYSAVGSTETARGLTGGELTPSGAMFRFDGERPELIVGVIDRCETDGYWSFYAGAATDTPYAILIRDTETNELNQYGTGLGSSIRDTQAFRCQ